MIDFKSFDWRSLQKWTSPQAANDLNEFLENLPQTAGQGALIAAGIAWTIAASAGLYATIQSQKLTEMRAELEDVSALTPNVPKLVYRNVNVQEIRDLAEDLRRTYNGVQIKPQGNSLYITAETTASFGQFREVLTHIQNSGRGWRVTVDRLCVGRECAQQQLAILLKIQKVDIEPPKS